MADVGDGFVVCGENRDTFRTWGETGPEWTPRLVDALWFARRSDAEKFCRDDEDAWFIVSASVLRRELSGTN